MNEIAVQAVLAELERQPSWNRVIAAKGQVALTLARRLDADDTPAMAQVAKELRVLLDELGATLPRPDDALGRLQARQPVRLTGLPGLDR